MDRTPFGANQGLDRTLSIKSKIMIIVGITGLLIAILSLLLLGFLGPTIYGSDITNKSEPFDCNKCLQNYCQPYYDNTLNITTFTKSKCKDIFRVKDCSCTGLCKGCGSTTTNCNTTLPPGETEDTVCNKYPD